MVVEEVWVVWVRYLCVEWSGELRSGSKGNAAKSHATSGVLEVRHMSLPLWWHGDVSHVAVKEFVMQAEVNRGSLPFTIYQYRFSQSKNSSRSLGRYSPVQKSQKMSSLRHHTPALILLAPPHVQAAAAACLHYRLSPVT